MLRLFLIGDGSEEENISVTTIAKRSASAPNNTRNISSATNSIIPNKTEQSTNTFGELSKNNC